MDVNLSSATVSRGARLFGALTVVGLGSLVVFGGAPDLAALRRISMGFLGLAVASAALDLLIGAVRYQVFLRRIRRDSPLSLPLRADLANRFAGALTPSQTGGGAAQLYILHRGGIPVAEALPFLAINLLSTLVVFAATGGFTAWMLRDAVPAGTLSWLVRWGFGMLAALGAGMVVALARADLVERGCRALLARLEGRLGRRAGALRRAGAWVVANAAGYRTACLRFMREEPLLLVASLGLTALLYLNKFTLGYLILRGMGIDAPYLDVLAVQALLQFILFVAPSPGGSGIGEVTTAALMARFLEPGLLTVFTAVFRALLLYLPAAAGGVVLLAALDEGTRPPGGDPAVPRGGPEAGATGQRQGGRGRRLRPRPPSRPREAATSVRCPASGAWPERTPARSPVVRRGPWGTPSAWCARCAAGPPTPGTPAPPS